MNTAAKEAERRKRNRQVQLRGGPLDGCVVEAKELCELGFPLNHVRLRITRQIIEGNEVRQREAICEYHYVEYRNAHVFQQLSYVEDVVPDNG